MVLHFALAFGAIYGTHIGLVIWMWLRDRRKEKRQRARDAEMAMAMIESLGAALH